MVYLGSVRGWVIWTVGEASMDLALSEAERAVAKMLKAKYKMKWPFAANIAKDAVCVLEIERIKAELSTSETVT